MTENGSSGSEVGLALNVPASAPGVTIKSITAQAIVSPVTGDDAWLGFASVGQALPGGVELPYGTGSDYTANEQWTLPQGARDFETYVNCSTDRSSPTCNFNDSTHVPALNDITLTLADSVPPTVGHVSGTLASAAAAGATVSGNQTLTFDASDTNSGVRSATLTLTPEGAGAPYSTTIDYGPECAYDSWNACPLTQDASTFTLDTSALAQDTYAVDLTASDAAGNDVSDYLGTVTTKNVPHIANGSPCAGAQLSLTVNGKAKLHPVRYGRTGARARTAALRRDADPRRRRRAQRERRGGLAGDRRRMARSATRCRPVRAGRSRSTTSPTATTPGRRQAPRSRSRCIRRSRCTSPLARRTTARRSPGAAGSPAARTRPPA